MALLRDYHATVGEKIIKYSGTLERYAGDGVMVVFNHPVPVENPALQAVLMALEIATHRSLDRDVASVGARSIGFRLGSTRTASPPRAARLRGQVRLRRHRDRVQRRSFGCAMKRRPGRLRRSRVLTKVENAVKVEPVGEFVLKGIRRPLAAYNVIDAVA